MKGRGDTRTKIVATVGPASKSAVVLRDLVRAGVDVFRFNMSHGTRAQKRRAIALIRRFARQESRPVGILVDLQGPKIRLGEFERAEPFYVRRGDPLTLSIAPGVVGRPGVVPCLYPGLVRDVKQGERILVDDGYVELKVTRVARDGVDTRVVYGGLLKQFKGVNLPGTNVTTPTLTRRDLEDLKFALELGVDFVALSFVRSPADMVRLKRLIQQAGATAMAIAKIERREAVAQLPEILQVSDGMMVARGDMGVEVGTAHVPAIQKRIIKLCNEAGKPVITATQMLESMILNPRPTRAEASDVANAIYDGTSAVMLSAETASGAHPVLVVRTLARLIRITETEIFSHYEYVRRRRQGVELSIDHSTVRAAAHAAVETGARLIVVFTEAGRTARLMAQERVPVRIVGFTPRASTYRQLSLSWGVHPEHLPKMNVREQLLALGERRLLELGLGRRGDRVVFIAGMVRVSGATNMMTIRELGR